MKRWIASILLSLCTHCALAQVTAQIDHQALAMGETFNLIITETLDNNQSPGMPDLTPLQFNFNILGTERTMQYILNNGQASARSQWTILLSPKHAGRIRIPALSLSGERTQVLSIKVSDAVDNSTNPAPDAEHSEFFLKTSVDNQQPYVNQQVIYTVKLFNGQRLLDAEYQAPQVKDALLVARGTVSRYQTMIGDKMYTVEEQKYAIFPQKSGKLIIQSPRFTGLIYEASPRRMSTSDKNTVLQVKPKPTQLAEKNWLPSKQFTLSERYDNKAATLEQGMTLTREITLHSVGTPAQLLPELQFSGTDAWNVYSEKGREFNTIQGENLLGIKIIKLTYLFNKPGSMTIPALKVKWFNVTTQREEEASLPARTLTITASASAKTQTTPSQSELSQKPATKPRSPFITTATNHWGWWLVGGLALGSGLTLLRNRKDPSPKSSPLPSIKTLLHALDKACQSQDPETVKEALLAWGQRFWPQKTILNLDQLSRAIADPELKQQIQQLSQMLYAKNSSQTWQAQGIYQAVARLGKRKGIKDKIPSLPPIHP